MSQLRVEYVPAHVEVREQRGERRARRLVPAHLQPVGVGADVVGVVDHVGGEPDHLLLHALQTCELVGAEDGRRRRRRRGWGRGTPSGSRSCRRGGSTACHPQRRTAPSPAAALCQNCGAAATSPRRRAMLPLLPPPPRLVPRGVPEQQLVQLRARELQRGERNAASRERAHTRFEQRPQSIYFCDTARRQLPTASGWKRRR